MKLLVDKLEDFMVRTDEDGYKIRSVIRNELSLSKFSQKSSQASAVEFNIVLQHTTMGSLTPNILFNNLVITTVEPLEKRGHVESIDPTDFDMIPLDSYIPVVFAYKLAENSDAVYVQAVNRIKEGLQKVLIPFFPWAGKWVATPGGMQRQLLCDDGGIPFIEAYVDKSMDSVAQFSVDFHPVPELQGWDVVGLNKMTCKQQMQPDGLPCAFVQVTRFKCGGLVVAVSASHMLLDGKSFIHFMTAWSDLSRTKKTDKILDHNRGLVQPSTSRPIPSGDVTNAKTEMGRMKVYKVNAAVIDSIKREVKENAYGAYVSTNDCIRAHMWRTVSSLSFSINGGKDICMATIVEGRNRFYDHPVPNLLGNIITTMTAPKISTADLLNMPLSLIASKIREKLNLTPRETWLSPKTQAKCMALFSNEKAILWTVSSWTSFATYSIDFGFGNPLFVTGLNIENAGVSLQGLIMVDPPTPGVSSSAATMCILFQNSQILKALERHPNFLTFLPRDKPNHK